MSAKAGGTVLGLTKAKLLAVGVVVATEAGVTVAAVEQPEPLPAVALAAPSGAAAAKRTQQAPPASAASREHAATVCRHRFEALVSGVRVCG